MCKALYFTSVLLKFNYVYVCFRNTLLCCHIFIMTVFYDEHHIPQFIYKAFIHVRYNICRTLKSLYGTQ